MQKYSIKKALNIPEYKITYSGEKNGEIHIGLCPWKRKKAICSYCGESHGGRPYIWEEVTLRDLPISGRKVYLHVKKRYYLCPQDNRIHVEQIDFHNPHTRITRRFAKRVSDTAAVTTNTEAGWLHNLDDEVVYRIDKAHLEEQAKEKLEPIPIATHISIDEVSYRKYHNYLTNVVDTERKLVIWNQKGRKSEILDQYYQGIGPESCEKIESAAMDGARTYISSTSKYAVNALIVYDKFHLVQKLNHTVDTVRKLELRKARSEKNQELVDMMNCKQRFLLLKINDRLTTKQSDYLGKLCLLNEPIYKAMLLKDSFLQIYTMKEDPSQIAQFLANWMLESTNSGLQPFIELAQKLSSKVEYILNWFKQKVSSAISEGFNNKIKRLKRMAYGYKDIDYFRLKIHQHCGLLNPRLTS